MRTIEDNGMGRQFSVHHTQASLGRLEDSNWIDVPQGRYVQRDLEDQIREEREERQLNNSTNTQTMATITTSGILADLKSGYTRFKKDDKGFGSIEEKYGLTVNEVKELFQTPSLKARKTAEPKRKLEIIDDLAQPQGQDTTLTQALVNHFDRLVEEPANLETKAVLPDVPQDDSKVAQVNEELKNTIFA